MEALKKPMTLCHLLMHTSGIGYGPGSITPGVPLVARSAEEKHYKSVTVKQEQGGPAYGLCDVMSPCKQARMEVDMPNLQVAVPYNGTSKPPVAGRSLLGESTWWFP